MKTRDTNLNTKCTDKTQLINVKLYFKQNHIYDVNSNPPLKTLGKTSMLQVNPFIVLTKFWSKKSCSTHWEEYRLLNFHWK